MKIKNGISILICFLIISNIVKAQSIIEPVLGLEEWQKIYLKAQKVNGEFRYYACSSELDEVDPFEGGPGKYTMLNLFDNDPSTAWVEGVKGYGEGEIIAIGLGKTLPEKLIINNGYQKSSSFFSFNSRPKTVKITLFTGFYLEGDATETESIYRIRKLTGSVTFLLRDQSGEQDIPLNLNPDITDRIRLESLNIYKEVFKDNIEKVKEFCPGCAENPEFQFIVSFEIMDVYRGSKWDDTCISGFRAFYKDSKNPGIPTEDTIENIYESDDMDPGLIFVDTDRERQLILVDKTKMKEKELLNEGTSFDIVLMDVSPDKEWAQVNIMFSQEGAGKVEEYSVLYYTRSLQRIDTSLLDIIYGFNGFVEEDGKIWLDTVDGKIDLEELKKLLKDS
jgi:hypothetical protein